jgi:PhnB protein
MNVATKNPSHVSAVPPGYHTVNPWVIPKGAAEFIDFVVNVFGGEESPEARIPDEDGLLIHAEVMVGDSVIMIFDSKPDWPVTPCFLQVYVEDAKDVLTRAKGMGADIVTELTDAWYGEQLARFRDPWGNLWWINQRVEEVTEWKEEEPGAGEGNYIMDTLVDAMRAVGQ